MMNLHRFLTSCYFHSCINNCLWWSGVSNSTSQTEARWELLFWDLTLGPSLYLSSSVSSWTGYTGWAIDVQPTAGHNSLCTYCTSFEFDPVVCWLKPIRLPRPSRSPTSPLSRVVVKFCWMSHVSPGHVCPVVGPASARIADSRLGSAYIDSSSSCSVGSMEVPD